MDVKVTCECIKGGQAGENRPHTQTEDLQAGFWSCTEEAGVAILLVSPAERAPGQSRKEVTGWAA